MPSQNNSQFNTPTKKNNLKESKQPFISLSKYADIEELKETVKIDKQLCEIQDSCSKMKQFLNQSQQQKQMVYNEGDPEKVLITNLSVDGGNDISEVIQHYNLNDMTNLQIETPQKKQKKLKIKTCPINREKQKQKDLMKDLNIQTVSDIKFSNLQNQEISHKISSSEIAKKQQTFGNQSTETFEQNAQIEEKVINVNETPAFKKKDLKKSQQYFQSKQNQNQN